MHACLAAQQHRGELAHAGAEAQLIEKAIEADVELPEILLGQVSIRIYLLGSRHERQQQPLEVAQLLDRDRRPTLDQAPTDQPGGRQREGLRPGELNPVTNDLPADQLLGGVDEVPTHLQIPRPQGGALVPGAPADPVSRLDE